MFGKIIYLCDSCNTPLEMRIPVITSSTQISSNLATFAKKQKVGP